MAKLKRDGQVEGD